MSWAIERDESGQAIRLWWMGQTAKAKRGQMKHGCSECGYHFGWHKHGWSPEGIQAAFEQYGFDCYTQGCIDGVTTAKMRPDLIEFLHAADTTAGGRDG